MITYLDKTFCNSPNCQNKCGRQLTQEVRDEAERLEAWLSLGYFCDEDGEVLKDDGIQS